MATSATAAVRELHRAFGDEDYENVCALMTESARNQAGNIAHGEPTRCIRDVTRVFRMIDRAGGWVGSSDPGVARVRGAGRRRIVTVTAGDDWRAEVPLTKSRGRWRLDGFFGTALREVRRLERLGARAPSPVSDGKPVVARDGSGRPCPSVVTTRFPKLSGGCVITAKTKRVPIRVLTPFGDFKFDECTVRYELRVDAAGNAWTDALQLTGRDEGGCLDINPCLDPRRKLFQPWRGRITFDDGAFVHHMGLCLRTCVGQFAGSFPFRMERTAGGWRMTPTGADETGFRIDGTLSAGDGLALDAAGPTDG